eukprot:CAMPEP_0170529660 /NCGR_PEP_ID=MMETSP0209-20121228/27774_1 /TAXON_ID=665100 ORGANISM="Litonotus pictus, Strain P1" /NCGR_SAMPLE_ID=MMETSP0209 /ASSEMBLY_ACC=CAM_ASM_000301 /LENGTH=85 /DNA_ID=CAMNT_0010821887 /DNA_START=1 /DNA_END=259 /DNA_ORIENTATION=-
MSIKMKDEPKYSSINGDPDSTINKINQADLGSFDILSDKSVRSRESDVTSRDADSTINIEKDSPMGLEPVLVKKADLKPAYTEMT